MSDPSTHLARSGTSAAPVAGGGAEAAGTGSPTGSGGPVPRRLVLLGPQRLQPTVGAVIRGMRVAGPVVLVTAGWRDRELEDRELVAAIDRPAHNLKLGQRTAVLLERDPELALALRARQDRLKEAQRLYRLRLGHSLEAVRQLRRRTSGDEALLESAIGSALAAVRTLDQEHLARVAAIRQEVEEQVRPAERDAVVEQRRQLAAETDDARIVVIAGGHVAVLLNRMRLLDVAGHLHGRWVVAWSAGAMAIGGRILMFHDSPPQGAGDAELLDRGLGAYGGLVVLPDARRRLRLDDRQRVGLLAARLGPRPLLTLDDGARLDWRAGRGWRAWPGIRRLAMDGGLEAMGSL